MKHLILLLFLVPGMLAAQTDAALETARKKMEARNFAGANTDLSKIIESNPRNKNAFSLRGRAQQPT
ncbi:MAG: hypothetical protein IPJ20_10865 [Flammeovirgaceae bacterium]|nr:hypothetical protein [Flammeovirgaceae bacterium]